MISLQKAMRLGIAPETEIETDKVQKIHIREDCSPETISDILRLYGDVEISEPLPNNDFDKIIQKIYKKNNFSNLDEVLSLEKAIPIEEAKLSLMSATSIESKEDDAPAIQLLNSILAQGLAKNASDIHFEPNDDKFDIKMRIDGNIISILSLQLDVAPRLISRIKILGKINISERRLPQDGRVSFSMGSQIVDVRISTLPTGSGERVVLRILGKQNQLIKIDKLNMPQVMLDNFLTDIRKPHGLVLVTGPTGSGKTTTLYAALKNISDLGLNIMTIEDPIEITFPGISQTQVNNKIGLNFAEGLKAILRQDPDVIMVGEIRDKETASVALRASMTGHLVLSTLHTNTTTGAINRLKDLGIDTYLISSSLNCVIAQRLLRKYCINCKDNSIKSGSDYSENLVRLEGCSSCNNTGYQGRIAIFDYLKVDNTLKSRISNDEFISENSIMGKTILENEAQKLVNKNIVPKFEAKRMSLDIK